MKQPTLFLFSPSLFDLVRKDYAKIADAKQRTQKQEIEHLKHVIAGYKAAETKRKKYTNNPISRRKT